MKKFKVLSEGKLIFEDEEDTFKKSTKIIYEAIKNLEVGESYFYTEIMSGRNWEVERVS